MRAAFRVIATAVPGLFLIVGLSGCQFSYPFEISGVVRTPDGTPVSGVTVNFTAEGIRDSSFPLVTGFDGTFKGKVRIADVEFMREELPKWSLELSKEGYQPTTVGIGPKEKPESPGNTTIISTQVTLAHFAHRAP